MFKKYEELLQDYARYSFMNGIIDENTMNHLIEDAQNYISELSKLNQHNVSGRNEQLLCTFCGINPIDEVCKHLKICSEKKKVKAN